MSAAALKTLFHPFETGLLPLPGRGSRTLFLGVEAGLRLPEGFSGELSLVQGFRPDFLALERGGFNVSPQAEGEGYDLALVLCGRHRGQNELRIVEALERTADGAALVIAGAKEDGIASLAKRLSKLAPVGGQSPKYHGLAFWLEGTVDRLAVAAALRAANAAKVVDGRFATAPGMFSHDRADPGSRLLAEALPVDLSGSVADFCAGWGYLSAEVMARCPVVKSVDLYEADFASVEAARRNIVNTGSVGARFFWKDLLGEPVEGQYDAIVMNPPFHQGRAAEPEIGRKLIGIAAKALRSHGILLMVANRGLPYEEVLAATFAEHREIAGDRSYKVLSARRQRM